LKVGISPKEVNGIGNYSMVLNDCAVDFKNIFLDSKIYLTGQSDVGISFDRCSGTVSNLVQPNKYIDHTINILDNNILIETPDKDFDRNRVSLRCGRFVEQLG